MKSSNILNPLAVQSQAPLDGKNYVLTLAELKDLGTNNHKAFTYYEGLEIYCNEDKKFYLWREVKPEDTPGLLLSDFTYPANSTSFGVSYSGRTFNFFRVRSDQYYVHDQGTAASIWYIKHNMNKRPATTIVDSAGTEVEAEIRHIDINNAEVHSESAFAGKAYCN